MGRQVAHWLYATLTNWWRWMAWECGCRPAWFGLPSRRRYILLNIEHWAPPWKLFYNGPLRLKSLILRSSFILAAVATYLPTTTLSFRMDPANIMRMTSWQQLFQGGRRRCRCHFWLVIRLFQVRFGSFCCWGWIEVGKPLNFSQNHNHNRFGATAVAAEAAWN